MAKARNGAWQRAALSILAVVLFAAVGACSTSGGETAKGTATATSTATPSPAASSTASSSPTAGTTKPSTPTTPSRNTVAPTPAPAPRLAPSPAPASNTAELVYAAEMTAHLNNVFESLGRTEVLFDILASDPQVIFDDNWRLDLALELGLWGTLRSEVTAMVAPPRLIPAHQSLVSAMVMLDQAGADFATGLDTFDIFMLDVGSAKLSLAAALMNDASALVPPL